MKSPALAPSIRSIRPFCLLLSIVPLVACAAGDKEFTAGFDDGGGASSPLEDASPIPRSDAALTPPPPPGQCTNPLNQEGCACTAGQQRKCFAGAAPDGGIPDCAWGTQTCLAGDAGTAEAGSVAASFAVFGACVGSGKLDCSFDAGGDASSVDCSTGGSVFVNNIGFAGQAWQAGDEDWQPAVLCSGVGGVQCGSLGQGGTFSARCAGTYQVCARVLTNAGCALNPSPECVTVSIPTDGASVAMNAFPGFGPVSSACLQATVPGGSWSVSLDVTGNTTRGVVVQRPNVATNIATTHWGPFAGGAGSGGGSF